MKKILVSLICLTFLLIGCQAKSSSDENAEKNKAKSEQSNNNNQTNAQDTDETTNIDEKQSDEASILTDDENKSLDELASFFEKQGIHVIKTTTIDGKQIDAVAGLSIQIEGEQAPIECYQFNLETAKAETVENFQAVENTGSFLYKNSQVPAETSHNILIILKDIQDPERITNILFNF